MRSSVTIVVMYKEVKKMLEHAQYVVVIQAENPDGDSLGSALALEEILGDLKKKVTLYCAVDIPKYLRHLEGWSRVTNEFPVKADAAIIVDTMSDTLLSQTLENPSTKQFLGTHPVIIFDHHSDVEDNLPFKHEAVVADDVVATGELIARVAKELKWPVNSSAARSLYVSIMADSLGLTTQNVNASTFRSVADLVDAGAIPADIEEARRAYMKKSPEILEYKGKLIERIEYFLDGQLAYVHIPWEEIEQYSDQYNPSMLVIDEMRLVEDVKIAVALKSYPDGRVTGKIRANSEAKIADKIAGYFGGGGHGYAAGFRAYDDLAAVKRELVEAAEKSLEQINE